MAIKHSSTVVTVEMGKDRRPGDPITDAQKAEIKEKLRAAVEAAGPPPEGVPPPTPEQIDEAVEEMLLGIRGGSALVVSATTVVRTLGRIIEMLEALPDAIKGVAMGLDAARPHIEGHASGGHVFALGSAWCDVLSSIGSLQSARDYVQAALDCDCFPGKPPKPNPADVS